MVIKYFDNKRHPYRSITVYTVFIVFKINMDIHIQMALSMMEKDMDINDTDIDPNP